MQNISQVMIYRTKNVPERFQLQPTKNPSTLKQTMRMENNHSLPSCQRTPLTSCRSIFLCGVFTCLLMSHMFTSACGAGSDTDSYWAPACFWDILGFSVQRFTILICVSALYASTVPRRGCHVWFSPSCLVFLAASWQPSAKGCLQMESISSSSSKLPSVCRGSRRRIPTKPAGPPPPLLLHGQTQRSPHSQI